MNTGRPRHSTVGSWFLLAFGLAAYVLVQGVVTVLPLRHWELTPEADDALTYVLKTRQMQECFLQDCPALEDLRRQLFVPSEDPAAARQRQLAIDKVFPVYHPLFSVLLIGISRCGMDLLEAFRLVWALGPLIFGVAFAVWLSVLCGRSAAGVALLLLAFKVFPDSGLHLVVPSNLCMAVAVLVWSRIVARQGHAPFTWVIGTLVMLGLHPVGRIFGVMAAAMALLLAEPHTRRRLAIPMGLSLALIAAAFALPLFVHRPFLFAPAVLPVQGSWWSLFVGAVRSLQQVAIEMARLDEGLFGNAAIFCAAVVGGLFALPGPERRVASRVAGLYVASLLLVSLYVSNHPADVLLRMWTPLVALLFGLVARAVCACASLTLERWRQRAYDSSEVAVAAAGPALVLAVLVGYAAQMSTRGAEQVEAMSRYLRVRQPLEFSAAQAARLLSEAKPGDRVLYNSVIAMPYFFIRGTMQLGAVYTHPSFAGDRVAAPWLERPDLRFAVLYNPLVFHPDFVGRSEQNWWPTCPDFRESALNEPRRRGPVADRGRIELRKYAWIDLAADAQEKDVFLLVRNRGEKTTARLLVPDADGGRAMKRQTTVEIPAGCSDWIRVSTKGWGAGGRRRLECPPGVSDCALEGVRFRDGPERWPWTDRGVLTFQPRDGGLPVQVDFDPANLLPPALKKRNVSILDDTGSTVLLRLGRESDR